MLSDLSRLYVVIAICLTIIILSLIVATFLFLRERTKRSYARESELWRATEEERISEKQMRRNLIDRKLDSLKGNDGYLEAIDEFLNAYDRHQQKKK